MPPKMDDANVTLNSGQMTVFQTTNVNEFNPNMESWEVWKERLEIHFCEIGCTEDNIKKSILLKSIGAVPYKVLHSLCSPDSPVRKTYDELCVILDTQYTPPTIVFSERKKFHVAVKNDGESVAEWYARVKTLALNCKFGAHLDAFILNQFVMGLPNFMFERLCEEDETLTVQSALRKAMILETKNMAKVAERDQSSVNFVNRSKPSRKNGGGGYSGNSYGGNISGGGSSGGSGSRGSGSRGNFCGSRDNNGDGERKSSCSHCGWRNHSSQSCKYKNSKCHSCGKIGHLASVCYNKKRSVNYVSNDTSNDTSDVYSLPVIIDGVKLNAVCDTGAPCTLLPLSFYENDDVKKVLRPCHVPYVDYSGDKLKLVGEYYASITFEGKTKSVVVVVVESSNPPLLGRSFLRAFNFELLQVNNVNCPNLNSVIEQLRMEFSEVFEEKLDKIEAKLRDLIATGVLEPVDNSDWGTPLVPILKPNGDFRICGDYKVTINKFLEDFKYRLPRIEEIFASLEGGELFTKLDLSNAYNQLVLDEDSQLLCAWSTHIGTLKVKRLPFGVKTAAAIIQKTMENLFRGIPYVVVYQDDITVTGKNMQEHISTLRLVLQKLQSSGLKLNLKKSEFFKSKILYLGFNIDKNGLSKNND
ncbi:uncharacterized protein LOC131994788 [Stomoxys calcitrans]|uniref:uncharacterized protein LOC131994788 n=1 Tax=Stomoxys calcitrans TaxID=35570 RepID=UPI0027E256AB|nr:uncharacterized protein LOC131994788 [Stomoxys calcitrans]